MSKKLAYTVVVQERTPLDKDNPARGYSVGRQETFLAGQELPDWAVPFVGDHAFEPNDDTPAEVSQNGSRDPDPVAEKPAGNASLEAWQQYAAAQGVDVEGKSRDEIRDQFNS